MTANPFGVRRALTDPELAGIFDAITAATDTSEVVAATVNGIYTALLTDLGHTLDTRSPTAVKPGTGCDPSEPGPGRTAARVPLGWSIPRLV
jgi:hypothetical protein